MYVGDIAAAVGIKAPSLYKHFKSKQDIFSAILEELKLSYDEQAAKLKLSDGDADKDAHVFSVASEDTLVTMGKRTVFVFSAQ